MGFKSRKRKQAAISGPELESAATAENEVLEKGETSGPAKKKLKMKKRKASEGNDADLSATCHTASTANPSDKTSKGNAQSAADEVSHKVGTAPALQAAGKQRPKEVQKKKKMDSKTSNEGASVIIGGLPFSCTQEALLKDFSTCGQIRKVNLPKDPKTGLPKGFAFLLFAAQAGAQAALKFDGKDYRGRRISARMALDKPDIEKRKSAETFKDGDQQLTVFVASLPHDVQESKLRMRFSDAGHIKALKLPLNEAGKPKGFAFITFDAKDEVAKALKMNGKQFEGQCLVVRSAGARPQKTADNVKLQVQGNGVPEQNTAKGRGKGRSNSELTVFVSGRLYHW